MSHVERIIRSQLDPMDPPASDVSSAVEALETVMSGDIWDGVDAVLEHCHIVAWPVDSDGEEIEGTLPTFKYFVRHVGECASQPGLSRPTLTREPT